jgi:hypothetical protein
MTIAQNRDARIPVIPYNEPVFLTGRFAGATGAVPTPVSGTTKPGLTLTRTGAGAYTLNIPTPVGTIQMADAWVVSSNTTAKNVAVTPWSAGATTIALQVTFQANASATDLTTGTDELHVDLRLAATQTP